MPVDTLPEAVEQPLITYDHYVSIRHPSTQTYFHVTQDPAKGLSKSTESDFTITGGDAADIIGEKQRY
jgi:hypothetical protein